MLDDLNLPLVERDHPHLEGRQAKGGRQRRLRTIFGDLLEQVVCDLAQGKVSPLLVRLLKAARGKDRETPGEVRAKGIPKITSDPAPKAFCGETVKDASVLDFPRSALSGLGVVRRLSPLESEGGEQRVDRIAHLKHDSTPS